MAFYTYVYIDPRNGVPFYVGKGTKHRWKAHLTRATNNYVKGAIRHIREAGFEPTVKFLVTDVDEEFALLVEQEAIAKYGRRDLGTGTLFNMTDGGDGITGYVKTDAWKSKVSAKLKGRTVTWSDKISAGLKGKPWTEAQHEARRKSNERKKNGGLL